MKTYRTNDGIVISGRTARDVIKALRASSSHPESSLATFMAAIALRVSRQTNNRIPTDSQTRFVAALVQAGLLEEQQHNE